MPETDIPFETLLADLHGDDWNKRCDAARMLGQSKDPRAVDALLSDLQDSNWKVRRNAAQALGALKANKAVDALLEVLNDRVATVRERAAVALGRIKDPRTIPVLVKAIIEEKDATHFHVNEGAYQAIRKFGKKAGPALMERFQAQPNMYLLQLLADSKYEVSIDFLIALAESVDPAMRRTAYIALGKRSDPRVVTFLSSALDNYDVETQILAVQALGQLRAVQAVPILVDLLREDQLFGPRAGLYRAICDAFQEISGIKKDVENVFPIGSKPSFNVAGARVNLSEMIGMMGNEGFQKLNQALANMENRASELAGKFNLPLQVIQNIMDQTWKFGATLADGRDARDEQMKLLIELLKSEASLTRAGAALSLPWYRDAQALDPLEKALQDEDDIVRRAATWAYTMLRSSLPA